MAQTVNGVTTTYFVGAHYELTGSTVTKYYFAGATRIAMRKYTIPQPMTVEYLISTGSIHCLGDHLGSTSITTDANGAKVSEMRYKPWGEVRSWWTAGLSTTPAYKLADYTFTGQFSHMDDPSTTGITEGFGLMFYNARWMDPALGRFTSPDTIIPMGQGVQAWDRYAYTNNNPVRYTDPSGHCIGLITCSLTLLGVLPDYFGIIRAMVFTKADDAVVAAGLAVQSEWLGPQDIPAVANAYDSIRGNEPGSHHYGWAQTGAEVDDPFDSAVATQAMETRINNAIDACTQCETGADKLIVAALAQNGFDFSVKGVGKLPEDNYGHIDWDYFLSHNGGNPSDGLAELRQNITGLNYDTQFMLKLYIQDLRLFMKLGYKLPAWVTKEDVKYVEDNYMK